MEAKRSTILLVEDNPDDEELTLRAFRESNLEDRVIVVRDGVEAMDYLLCTGPYAGRDSYDLPDLVLLDLRLPRLDGIQVLHYIRHYGPTRLLPVVVLSVSRERPDVMHSYSLGANSYIVKPVNYSKFAAAIQQLGLYWLELNESPTPRRAALM